MTCSHSSALVQCVLLGALCLLATDCIAQSQQPVASTPKRCVLLQLYIRSDSKVCQEARKYVETLSKNREGICVDVYDTLTDEKALDRYRQLVRKFRVENPRVPLFYVYDRLQIGFSSTDKSAAAVEDLFAIHAYVRSTCQHCRDAKKFLNELASRWKGIRLVFHDVDRESGAIQKAKSLAQQVGISAPSFPVIFICGRVMTGYRTDATTGRQIEDLLIKASTIRAAPEPKLPNAKQDDSGHKRSGLSDLGIKAWLFSYIGGVTTVGYASDRDAAKLEGLEQGAAANTQSSADLQPPLSTEEGAADETYVAPADAPQGIDLPWVGYVSVRDIGLPAFTLLIGLVDGFNPCAMWVLVFLLSVLVTVKDRWKIAAIAGTFVAVSGLAYFAFMAAWLNVFMLVGIARPLQIALGVLALTIGAVNVKDFFVFKKGITLSIPEAAKPGIYARVRRIVTTDYISIAIGLSVILAIAVNVVELLCTAGLPAIYTQILTLQDLPVWKNYAYLGLYNVAYMLDDSIMVIAFLITLSHRKMREAEGRWLKLISGLVVLSLGWAMLFRPDWLLW